MSVKLGISQATMKGSDGGETKVSRWYFGGLSAAGAVFVTHPLDLIKVLLQTQQEGKVSIIRMTGNIVRTQGVLALYNGVTASLCRQLTYSLTRFAIYDVMKRSYDTNSFGSKVLLATFAGAIGGLVGTPADLVNVRMQNDVKLPPEKRRNYKHVGDGFVRMLREEGVVKLFTGASVACTRAVMMTVGQISIYEQVKMFILNVEGFTDNLATHFLSSLCAGIMATTMTQPLDVVKTRMMNAKPGEFRGVFSVVLYTAKLGPMGFFKGYIPSFVRIGPHTIITFLLMEQLRQNFGY